MNIAEEYAKLYWRCHSKKLWGKNRTPIELITDEHFANIPKFLRKKYPEDIINIEDLPRWLTREIKRREMLAIKRVFPECSLDYLFETSEKSGTA